jgi:hypothetical protein
VETQEAPAARVLTVERVDGYLNRVGLDQHVVVYELVPGPYSELLMTGGVSCVHCAARARVPVSLDSTVRHQAKEQGRAGPRLLHAAGRRGRNISCAACAMSP